MATNNSTNTSLDGQTGSGQFVGNNTPSLVTPNIGAATGTSLNLGSSTTITGMIDDDTMATASASTAASSESLKAYIDAQVASAGGTVLIDTATFSGDATYELTNLSTDYFEYRIICNFIVPSVDGAHLYMRTSTNNGSSFDSGVSDYEYAGARFRSTTSYFNSTAASEIMLAEDVGASTPDEGFYGTISLLNPMSSSGYTVCTTQGILTSSGGTTFTLSGSGERLAASATNAIQLLFSSGNIASGSLIVLGVKSS